MKKCFLYFFVFLFYSTNSCGYSDGTSYEDQCKVQVDGVREFRADMIKKGYKLSDCKWMINVYSHSRCTEVIKMALAMGADVNEWSVAGSGATPLGSAMSGISAVKESSDCNLVLDAIVLLINAGADIKRKYANTRFSSSSRDFVAPRSTVTVAVDNCRYEMAKMLISKGLPIDEMDLRGAVRFFDVKLVKLFLDSGVDAGKYVDSWDCSGYSVALSQIIDSDYSEHGGGFRTRR